MDQVMKEKINTFFRSLNVNDSGRPRNICAIVFFLSFSVFADSNSDYRAGSDFARQIQGQGIGSIQSFNLQESIPGYNANPDETQYYGGVTAGGDGGLKNNGTTQWATSETGKTITEVIHEQAERHSVTGCAVYSDRQGCGEPG